MAYTSFLVTRLLNGRGADRAVGGAPNTIGRSDCQAARASVGLPEVEPNGAIVLDQRAGDGDLGKRAARTNAR